MKRLKKYKFGDIFFITLFVIYACIDVLMLKQDIRWGDNALIALFAVAMLLALNISVGLLHRLLKKKNVCEDCKHNDPEAAKAMFFTNYCKLWDCSTSGKYKCKQKEKIK